MKVYSIRMYQVYHVCTVVLFAFELCEFHVHLNRSSSMKSITPYGRIDPRILTIL